MECERLAALGESEKESARAPQEHRNAEAPKAEAQQTGLGLRITLVSQPPASGTSPLQDLHAAGANRRSGLKVLKGDCSAP